MSAEERKINDEEIKEGGVEPSAEEPCAEQKAEEPAVAEKENAAKDRHGKHEKLAAELSDTMAMCGAVSIKDINRSMLYRPM